MFSAALFTQKWNNQKKQHTKQKISHRNETKESSSNHNIGAGAPFQDEDFEEKTLHVTLRLNETKTDSGDNGSSSLSNVFYNQNENRFTQESTLNLKIYSLYRISVELDVSCKLEYFALGRKTYLNILKEQPDKEFFEIVDDENKGTRNYSFVYSTDKIRATDRHHRSVLPCSLKLQGYGELKFQLLVYFCHSNKNDHLVGVPLSAINLNVTFGGESTLDDICYE